jgi:hypothetical protein
MSYIKLSAEQKRDFLYIFPAFSYSINDFIYKMEIHKKSDASFVAEIEIFTLLSEKKIYAFASDVVMGAIPAGKYYYWVQQTDTNEFDSTVFNGEFEVGIPGHPSENIPPETAGNLALVTVNGTLQSGKDFENNSLTDIPSGSPVAILSSGVQLASASDSRFCIGLAKVLIEPGHAGNVVNEGYVTKSDWTDVVGEETLSFNAIYYLQDEPGKLSTVPSETRVQEVGRAINSETLQINILNSIKL